MSDDPPQGESTGTRRRRWLRIAAVTLVVLALAVASLYTSPVRRSVAGWIEGRLADAGIDARIGELGYGLLGLEVELLDLRLQARGAAEPFLVAERLYLDLPWSVVTGDLAVDAVELAGADLRLVRGPDGGWNLPIQGEPVAADVPGPSLPAIGRVRIERTTLRLDDAATGVGLTLPDIGFSAAELAAGGQIDLARPGTLSFDDRSVAIEELRGGLAWDGSNLTLADLTVAGPPARLALDGSITNLASDPTWSMDVDATADAAGVTRLLGLEDGPAGSLAAEGRVEGPLAEPVASLRLTSEAVGWTGLELTDLSSGITASTGSLTVESLEAGIAGGRATGTAELRLADAATGAEVRLPGSAHVELEGIDPDALPTAWPPAAPDGDGIPRLATRVDATLDASWDTWPGDDLAALTADLAISARQRAGAGLPLHGDLRLTIDSGTWTLRGDPRLADALRLDAGLEGRLASPLADSTLGGSLVATASDLSRLPPALEELAGTLPELAGSGRAELALGGTLGRPGYRGPVELRDVRAGPAAAGRLTATLAGGHGQVALEDLSVVAGTDEITGDARLDLGSGTLEGSLRAELSRLATLLPGAPTAAVPEGEVTVVGSLGGTIDAPRVDLTARGAGLRVAGQPALDVEARAVVSPGAIRVEDLVARQRPPGEEAGPRGQPGREREAGAVQPVTGQADRLAACGPAPPEPTEPATGDPAPVTALTPGCLRLTATYQVAAADLSFEAVARELRLEPLALSDLEVPISGTVDLRADAGLGEDGFRGTATLTAAGLQARGLPLGPLQVEASGAGDAVELTASAPELGTSLRGRVSREGPYELRVEANELPLERFLARPSDAADPAAGDSPLRLTATLDVAGDLTAADPLSRASAELQALDGSVDGVPVRLLEPGTVELTGSVLRTAGVELGLGEAKLRLEGSWPGEDERLLATLTGDLGDLEPLFALAGFDVLAEPAAPEGADATTVAADLDLAGALEARVELAGPADAPRASGRFVVRGGVVTVADLPPFRELSIELFLEDGAVTLEELSTSWQDAALTASGRLPLGVLEGAVELPGALADLPRAPGAASLEARVGPLTRDALRPFLPAEAVEMAQGRVVATTSLTAEALRPEAVRGGIVLEEADVTIAGARLAQREPTRLEIADGRVEVRALRWGGAGTELRVTGSAPLRADEPVSLQARGTIDLRVLQLLVPGATSAGTGELAVDLSGSPTEPVLGGSVDVRDAELRIPAARLVFRGARGRIFLDGQTLVIEPVAGELNGGAFVITGSIPVPDPSGGRIEMRAVDVAAQPAEGLRSLLAADLALDFSGEPPGTLSGTVTIARGSYRERMSLVGQVLDRVRDVGEVGGAGTGSALDDLRLDVRLVTEGGFLVDNNLADLEMTADLELTGTLGAPGLTGRAEVVPGGTVFLTGNRFRVETGTIDFTGVRAIEPEFDITARTRVREYDVTLRIGGTPEEPEVDLSSNPALPQSDVASLLLTGRRLGGAEAAQTTVAQEQLISLLASEFTGRLADAVGLDTVRLERGPVQESFRNYPSPIATEQDPTQRLTISKQLSPDLELVFSQALGGSGDLTWLVNYELLDLLELQVLFDDDNNRAFQVGQQLGFGGGEELARPAERDVAPTVSEVAVEGDSPLPQDELRDVLELEPGDRFEFFLWQEDRERLVELHHEEGRLEARVDARRETPGEGDPETATSVRLVYTVEAGPHTVVTARGFELTDDLRETLEQSWARSVLDDFLIQEAAEATRLHLAGRGFVAPTVEVSIEGPEQPQAGATGASPAVKRLVLQVDPGPLAGGRRVDVTGNQRFPAERVREVVEGLDPPEAAWARPGAAADALRSAYAAAGMPEAAVRIGEPRVQEDAAVLRVEVDEGPLYRIGEVSFAGLDAISVEEATSNVELAAGDPYVPSRVAGARRVLEALYRTRGYTRAEIRVETEGGDQGMSGAAGEDAAQPPDPAPRPAGAETGEITVPVTFRIQEGPVETVAAIEVTGAEVTHPGIIDDALGLREGDPVDREVLARSRKRLYDTGAFRRVDVEVEPMGPAEDGRLPVRLLVSVGERPPYRFRYGLRLNSNAPLSEMASREYQLGLSGDLTSDNLLGRTISAGLAGRYQSDFQAGRAYVTTPRLFGLPLISSAFLRFSRERIGEQGLDPFLTDIGSLTLEQRFSPFDSAQVAYSYSFERNHTYEEGLDPDDPFAFDLIVDISRFATSGLVDTRDDPLDATRGFFHSSQLEYADTALGSDLSFVKYVLQQYWYRRVGPVTLASAARFGVAAAFDDQETVPSERFFAGGGNSVRGYAEDSLGPTDFFGDPTGGNALLELKQEVRFPIVWWFRGAAFVDAGNVFSTFGDISLGDLAVGTGVGLRVNTPFALVRIDYGLALDREPGDPRGRFYFSIGQAF